MRIVVQRLSVAKVLKSPAGNGGAFCWCSYVVILSEARRKTPALVESFMMIGRYFGENSEILLLRLVGRILRVAAVAGAGRVGGLTRLLSRF